MNILTPDDIFFGILAIIAGVAFLAYLFLQD